MVLLYHMYGGPLITHTQILYYTPALGILVVPTPHRTLTPHAVKMFVLAAINSDLSYLYLM